MVDFIVLPLFIFHLNSHLQSTKIECLQKTMQLLYFVYYSCVKANIKFKAYDVSVDNYD